MSYSDRGDPGHTFFGEITSMKNSISFLFVLNIAIVATLAGCATTGEIPVDLGSPGDIHISPANQDGIQDDVTFDLRVLPLERTRLTRYEIDVTNLAGRPVRTIREEVPHISWFRRILPRNRKSVDPPEVVLWDGRDDAGAYVPDGLYYLNVRAWDNKGNQGEAPVQRIVVDNTPPDAQLSAPFLLFTPNGDGRNDRIPIYQRRATREDLWTGRIHDRYGAVIREYLWEGVPEDFEWDGLGDEGRPAPEGLYSYILSATDRAGNSAAFDLAGIELELTARTVGLALDRYAFSPNGDGVADTVTITPRIDLSTPVIGWSVEVFDIQGTVQRMYRGTSTPEPILFDGYGATGVVLPDGEYRAAITVEYRGGQQPRSASPVFVLDNTPPRAVVRAGRTVFSPDGDGRNDTVEFIQSSTTEQEWTGLLTNAAGETIRSLLWRGEVSNFIWDGTDAEGEAVPDGTYTYTLNSVDEAGNAARPAIARVRLDSRPTPVAVRTSASRFSPNGDGLHDSITFTTAVTVTDGIQGWTLAIRNAEGRHLGIVSAGRNMVPQEIQWYGAIEGARLPDGLYRAHLEVSYEKGNLATAQTTAVQIDTVAPVLSIRTTPERFSPDGDGIDDVLTIRIDVRDESPIARWSAILYDREGQVFMNWSGTGSPRNPIRWDGRSSTGELVQSAQDYLLVAEAVDVVQNRGRADHTVPVDILVLRDSESPDSDLRIQITSIYFVPFTADYLNLDPETVARNLETLDRIAEVLRRYPDRTVRIEGHAVSVFWYDPVRSNRENQQVLIPLSRSRADAIRAALVERGIPARRMTTAGYGGTRPMVPHGDLENRWKSRRVEFVLQQ
ncbi:MAG: hypothetical protein EA427_14295 [Spirochaetaceae bacterium]|nr:MAG: hypothetical protein EA427_14295 [Spirochaetaceae bacterium]